MDVERIVFRLIADASSYFNVLDKAQSRLLFFATFMTEHMSRAAFKMAAEYEQAAVSFEVMTGSATEAHAILQDLAKLALETPFSFSDVLKASKQIKAFGFDVADITTIIGRLGDVASATGTDINRIILAFGQVRTTGRLMGQELRQFSNAGIPILDYLARVTGKSVSAIPQLVRQGRISFTTVSKAFNLMTNEGGLFGGMMERISKETIGGRWQNFAESLSLMTRRLGEMVIEAFNLKGVLTDLAQWFQASATDAAIDRWRTRLENVRAVLGLVWMTGKAAWGAIVDGVRLAWDTTVRLYQQNEQLIKTVLVLYATYKLLAVATWAWFASLAAIRTGLLHLMLTLVAIRTVLITITSLAFLGVIAAKYLAAGSMLVAVFKTLLGIMTALLSPVGLLLVAFGGLTYVMLADGKIVGTLFDSVTGSVDRLWGTIKLLAPAFKAAWDGIVGAVRGGDLGLAFDLGVASIKLAWKGLVHWMSEEWTYFVAKFKNTLKDVVTDSIWASQYQATIRLYRNIPGMGGRADAMQAELDKTMADQAIIRAHRDRMTELLQPTPQRIAGFVGGLPEFAEMSRLTDLGRITGVIGKDLRDFAAAINGERPRFDIARPGDQLGLDRTIGRRMNLESGFAALMGPAAEGLQQEYQHQLVEIGLMYQRLQHLAQSMRSNTEMLLEGTWRVPNQEDLARQGARMQTARAELDRFTESVSANGRAAREARRALPTPLEVSAGARKAAQELERIFETGGFSPIDQFLTKVQDINEAFRGPYPAELMGVLPAAAVVGNRTFGGLIGQDMKDYGLMKAYEEFRRGLPNEQERRPAAAMFGSREAVEILNRARGGTTDVQQQIKAELATANFIAQQTAANTAQVVEALRELAAAGGGKIMGRRVDGGGDD